jgi:isopenicillin N synthase-like dioxygenase
MNVQVDTPKSLLNTSNRQIPIIDIGNLLDGKKEAIQDVSIQLKRACNEIGFFFVINHNIDQKIIDSSFEHSEKYFSLPMNEKIKVRQNRHQCGYMPPDVAVHNDTFENRQTALNTQRSEAFKFSFDLNSDDPDFGQNIRFRGYNKWPDPNVSPGLHKAFMDFHMAFQNLAVSLLEPLAASLDMASDFFNPFFERSSSMTRIAYYPAIDDTYDQVSLPGHRDSSFLSFIPPASRPGLEIMMKDGQWIQQPVVENAVLVNTGTVLVRWANDRYLATPHRVRANSKEARYSNIFFLYPDVSLLLECLPTCFSKINSQKYKPFTFGEFHAGYCERNFGYAENWD